MFDSGKDHEWIPKLLGESFRENRRFAQSPDVTPQLVYYLHKEMVALVDPILTNWPNNTPNRGTKWHYVSPEMMKRDACTFVTWLPERFHSWLWWWEYNWTHPDCGTFCNTIGLDSLKTWMFSESKKNGEELFYIKGDKRGMKTKRNAWFWTLFVW